VITAVSYLRESSCCNSAVTEAKAIACIMSRTTDPFKTDKAGNASDRVSLSVSRWYIIHGISNTLAVPVGHIVNDMLTASFNDQYNVHEWQTAEVTRKT